MDYTSTDESAQATQRAVGILLAVFGIFGVLLVVVMIVTYVLIGFSLGALFRKTGVEPWKAWVPVYGTYEWLRLGGQNGHWVWLLFVPGANVVTSIFLYMGMHATGKAFRKDTGFLVLGILLPIVWLLMLGFGSDRYEPELIAYSGLRPPLVGYGAVHA